MVFFFKIKAIIVLFVVLAWTQGSAIADAQPVLQVVQAKASEMSDRMLDDIFTNFQMVEVVGSEASGYLDIQNLYKEHFSQAEADAFFSTFARKADELLPFFTDKKPTVLKIQIIRITNIDQYNVGSGFSKVGNVRLEKQGDGWKVQELTLIDGGAK